jgi:DGQHR domain-containing protein
LRVPVLIYNNLKKSEEVRLFMDINTKQRPVPSELILDIKRMAETEKDHEKLFRSIFDLFQKESDSPLFGLLSPAERKSGKISRTTFNAALKPILETFEDTDAEYAYDVLKAYLNVWKSALRAKEAENNIVNPTLFRAIVQFFPSVVEKVTDRHGDKFTVENFDEVLSTFFNRLKKSQLQSPGSSIANLCETFKDTLRSGISIGRRRE